MNEKAGSERQTVPSSEYAASNFSASIKDLKHPDERTASLKDYLRIFTYAAKGDFAAYAAGVLAAIGSGITNPLMYVLFGNFVSSFSDLSLDNLGGGRGEFEPLLSRLCLYMFALFIARLGLSAIHRFVFRMIGIRLSAAIRLHYLKHLFGQSIHVLDSLPPGHALSTLTSSGNVLQMGISEKLGVLVECSALIIASIIVAFIWSWELALVTISGIVAIMLAVGTILPFATKGHSRQAKSESSAAAIASEALAGMRMIMACSAEQRTASKYAVFVEEAKKYSQSTSLITSFQFAATFFGVFGTVGLSFWYGTKAFVEGRLNSVGEITVVLLTLMSVFFSLDRIVIPTQAITKASVAACEFFSVIDAPSPDPGHLLGPQVCTTSDIHFEKVTFSYPSRPHIKILDEVDLFIEAGKITAIVGPSGSGKSTVISLIERWYTLKKQHIITHAVEKKNKNKKTSEDEDEQLDEPAIVEPVRLSGTISFGDHSLDDINLQWWRSQIGLVQQEPVLYNDTVYGNVARGLIGSNWEAESEEQKRILVVEACKEAFADKFIEKLPKGYDTSIGDGGATLSGGQRQRIAIARSIVRKPTILILDEATSALDARSELMVQRALNRVSQNRTTIVVAHRLSTIKYADRIIVMKKGKVVETGTHESLLALQDSVYSGLVNAQALTIVSPTQQRADENDENAETEAIDALGYTRSSGQDAPCETFRSKENPKKGFATSVGFFLKEAKGSWHIVTLIVFFAAAAGTAMPMHAWLFSRSINLFQDQDTPSKLMSNMEFMAGMWAVFAVASGIAYFVTYVASNRVASVIRADCQRQYFEAILFQPAAFFDEEDHSLGTLTARLKDDPMKLEDLLGINMAMVYISIFNIIGSIAMAISYAWKLALVSICVIFPVCIFAGYFRFRYELQFEMMNDSVFAESSQFASEAINSMRTVTSLTIEASICTRFEDLCHGHVVAAYKKARWVSIVLGFSDSATLGCQSLIFYYGGRLLVRDEISFIAFFVCLMSIMNAGEGFGQSLSVGPNAAQATAASGRILDVRESRMVKHRMDEEFPEGDGGVKIEFLNVHFKYPTRETPVLNGISFTIEKGQFCALVGASGCGKTSIVSLLERFYEPTKGRILCNGKDISDFTLQSYRKQLSLVTQESMLFHGTIKENILIGTDPTVVTDDHLHSACRDAMIHDFIVSLPEGYNTNIGARGVSLSGGQKQRISIARALIRDPQLLLLDEATSSLDSENEKLVQAALEQAAKNRTILLVAHRLATVQNADVIFVLGEGGSLIEKGNHAELLSKKTVYYQMCQGSFLD